MDLHARYPGLDDLRRRAQKRLPHFVFEYLDSGTGREQTTQQNATALQALRFLPSVLHGPQTPNLAKDCLGLRYKLPFGIAPVGMSGLIWPDAERLLAKEAVRAGLPYCLSTVASQTPEHLAPVLGDKAWFQLYPPKEEALLKDLLARVKSAGFAALVLTLDVPVASRRARQVKGGLVQPPRLTPRRIHGPALFFLTAAGLDMVGTPFGTRKLTDHFKRLGAQPSASSPSKTMADQA